MVFAWLSLEKHLHCHPQMGKVQDMIVYELKLNIRYESWKTDRPMRKEGFNIGAKRGNGEWVSRQF